VLNAPSEAAKGKMGKGCTVVSEWHGKKGLGERRGSRTGLDLGYCSSPCRFLVMQGEVGEEGRRGREEEEGQLDV
jgi:hypothetical protein